MKKIIAGAWYDVKGYEGKYQVNSEGQCRHVFKSTYRMLTAFKRKQNQSQLFWKLTDSNGRSRDCLANKTVWETFYGAVPDGMRVYHKNGIISDNFLGNLELVTLSELGKRSAHKAKARSVVKIDASGQIVDYYRSAARAGKANYMSGTAICDRCNNKVKKGPAADGYEYAWESSIASLRNARKRMRGSRNEEQNHAGPG